MWRCMLLCYLSSCLILQLERLLMLGMKAQSVNVTINFTKNCKIYLLQCRRHLGQDQQSHTYWFCRKPLKLKLCRTLFNNISFVRRVTEGRLYLERQLGTTQKKFVQGDKNSWMWECTFFSSLLLCHFEEKRMYLGLLLFLLPPLSLQCGISTHTEIGYRCPLCDLPCLAIDLITPSWLPLELLSTSAN